MNEEKDNWEELKNLPDDYEYDASIAQRAIERIQQEKARKSNKEGWWRKHWRPMAVSLATCAVIVGVGIPVYHSLFNPNIEVPPVNSSENSSTVYYDENHLTVNPITDVGLFVQEQALNFKFFTYPNTMNYGAVITNTGEFAYLRQEMLYIGADGFDQVKLWSEVLTSANFDFEDTFKGLDNLLILTDVTINYHGQEEVGTGKKEIRAKFTYESVNYYLEIITAGETETKIEQYVNLLIG